MDIPERIGGSLYLYNLGNQTAFDENLWEELPKTDFLKKMKNYFGDLKENGNHKSVKRNEFTIYFGWRGELQSGIEVSYYGKDAVIELMKLSRKHNWAVAHPYQRMQLINLLSLHKEGFENLDDFFEKNLKFYQSLQ